MVTEGHHEGVSLRELPLSKQWERRIYVRQTHWHEFGLPDSNLSAKADKRLLENCIANTYNVLDSFMSKLLRVHGGCLGARSR